MPRPDADPMFHALLDSDNGMGPDGTMSVELDGMTQCSQAYEPGTAIVHTRMFDAQGAGIEVTDFAPRYINRGRMFRPAQLVRRVRPLADHPQVRFIVRPRANWAATTPTQTRGSNHLRFVTANWTLRLNTNAPLSYLMG